MYRITTKESFDSAHFLSGYEGKCSNIHGHRWKVVLTIQCKDLKTNKNERGMCMDFSELKGVLKDVLEKYDHTLLIEEGSLKPKTVEALEEEGFPLFVLPFRPTAENFSKYFYDIFTDMGYDVYEVSVFETPNNCATYVGD
ncbi:MAG: 6-carboxytetrahydropterin synthase QueD [Lachnospiraceae bacterium]|nr:6-carboxytetrahydropterin synthase QueD [Lachnospiraceae bacterium]